MPVYSTFQYGSGPKYGEFLSSASHATVSAQTIDYTKVKLTVNVSNYAGSTYAVLRTSNGAAEHPSAGLVVFSGTVTGSGIINVVDGQDNLPAVTVPIPNGFVYYTLFLFDSYGRWKKYAATSVLVPKDRGTRQKFLEFLPGFYTSVDNNILDPFDPDSELAKFLYGFTLTYDELAETIDLILPENRTRNVIRRMHGALCRGKGMPDEYTIGSAANSRLFSNAGYIYRSKGTPKGIVNFAESLTGWPIVVKPSTNMFLSLDDGSFEYSIGQWTATGGTLTKTTGTGPTFSYEGSTSQFSRLGIGNAVLSSSTMTMTLPTSDRSKMIPVTAGTTYYFNIPAKATVGTPTVQGKITWIDGSGATISTSTLTSATTSSSWAINSRSATAPTGAKYAVLSIVIAGSTGNTVQLDMLNFTANNSFYRDPRAVTVIVEPVRLNYVFDPSFQASSTGWTATTGTITNSTDKAIVGTKSGKAAGSPFSFYSNTFPVQAGYVYDLSAYASSSGGSATAHINWYDSGSSLISSDSLAFGTLGSSWTKLEMTAQSPANAVTATVSFSGSGTVYFDAVIMSLFGYPQVFFSGNIADQDGQDALWSGTAELSYSLLYPLRYTKLARLRQTLPYYLPVGVTSRILFWDSTDPEVTAMVPNG